VRPVQALPDPEEEEEEGKHNDKGIRQDRPVQVLVPGGIMKREPASFLEFPTLMRGHRIIIDLTRVGNADGDAGDADADALQAQLADNYLAPNPPASVDVPLKRSYRLSDQNISSTLKHQCILFGEWRSALWNWSRDDAPVSATTFDGNISNLLLFAGYATAHAPRAHRITPPRAFDLSVVFGSQEVLEPLVVSYLRWLRRERRVMYSTTLGYLNSLVVMANFHFADTANSSFDAGKNEQAVKSGLRRLRSHADSASRKEGKHKPVHPDWVSWRSCQWTRRRAARAYLRRKDGSEGGELKRLYAALEAKRKRGSAEESDALKVIRHPLYVCLQQLVCLYLHTIAPPVRVAITRCLQFRTTFVKMRNDPSRYVIDLKNNPNSPSARHKTSSHYRNAILPQPSIERMTEFIDCLRSFKVTELKKAKRFVFISRLGEPFAPSAWTAFVKRSWAGFARAPPEGNLNATDVQQPSRQPPPSHRGATTLFDAVTGSFKFNLGIGSNRVVRAISIKVSWDQDWVVSGFWGNRSPS
jgi:hypothetical protein